MKTRWIALLTMALIAVHAWGETYTVQAGDTLSKIAQTKLGESERWKEIAELNNLKEPYRLSIGQQLEMPKDSQQALSGNEQTAITEKEKAKYGFKNILKCFSFLSIPLIAIIGIWLVSSLFSCLLFAAGYNRACKIFNVETTYGKSFLAAICFSGIGTAAGFMIPGTDASSPPPSFFIVYAAVVCIAIVICLILLKYFFHCNWPQSIGIYVLGGIIGFLWHFLVVFLISFPLWITFLCMSRL